MQQVRPSAVKKRNRHVIRVFRPFHFLAVRSGAGGWVCHREDESAACAFLRGYVLVHENVIPEVEVGVQ